MVQAIVTGGAVRVGRGISIALADKGYDIILIFNNSLDEAKELAAELAGKGRQCYLYKVDISRKENLDELFAEISRKFDDIKLLVNNASVFEKSSFSETSEQVFDDHMDINFKAPFFLSQNFLRYVESHPYIRSANIVNIVDANINEIRTGHFIYHLSKKALNDLTLMLAEEISPHIRVNSLALGKVLPSKEKGKVMKPETYPRIKELTGEIIRLQDSDINGKVIYIESDPQLKGNG